MTFLNLIKHLSLIDKYIKISSENHPESFNANSKITELLRLIESEIHSSINEEYQQPILKSLNRFLQNIQNQNLSFEKKILPLCTLAVWFERGGNDKYYAFEISRKFDNVTDALDYLQKFGDMYSPKKLLKTANNFNFRKPEKYEQFRMKELHRLLLWKEEQALYEQRHEARRMQRADIPPVVIARENGRALISPAPYSSQCQKYLQQLIELESKCFSEHDRFSDSHLQSYFSRLGLFLLCRGPEDEELIGYCCINQNFDGFYTDSFAVSPEAQRQGHGQFIMNHVINYCIKNAPDKFLSLHVRQSNTAAQNLYAKLGFEIAKVSSSFYGDEPGFLLRRKLSADPVNELVIGINELTLEDTAKTSDTSCPVM